MEDNMDRLYGYCRKSTEKQNETSFEVQERKNLKKYKNIFGLLLTVYTEYDIIIIQRRRRKK